ncbi:MAG: hypothetical protein QXR09_02215 [Candidatus Aenigmatarchaeota archaeon]
MVEVLELIAKYSQSRAKDCYKEIGESMQDEIRNKLKNMNSKLLINIFNQVAFNQKVPPEIRKEVIFEYYHRGGKIIF